ncbi:MAG: aquaporin [Clostridiales Family XIII bacterium]|jgi:aquaporin Z|nr:aquaporin [Clostridiales Family XIII bacterium]
MKKFIAELIGTFVLVLFGTGTAVLGGGITGIGTTGIALAFGLTVVAGAYSIGNISGAHLNPAISVGMLCAGRIKVKEFISYVIAQIIGAILASAFLYYILVDQGEKTTNMGQNSFGKLSVIGAILVEVVLTCVFVLVAIGVTSKKYDVGKFAGIAIGGALTMVHLVGIPLTGTSVNPARSIGPALFAGGDALAELWVFILAPIIGGIIAAIIGKYLLGTEDDDVNKAI